MTDKQMHHSYMQAQQNQHDGDDVIQRFLDNFSENI